MASSRLKRERKMAAIHRYFEGGLTLELGLLDHHDGRRKPLVMPIPPLLLARIATVLNAL